MAGQKLDADFEELSEEIKTSGGFNLNEFLSRNFPAIAILLVGIILIGFGALFYKGGLLGASDKVEILSSDDKASNISGTQNQIVVELAGAVEKPSVYKLPEGSRISDLLIAGGGVSVEADRDWVERYINKAAILTDGQKVYIPKVGESQTGAGSANISSGINGGEGSVSGASVNASGLININTATLAELDKLPGIGPVYGQNIIDQRPYSSVEELLSRKVIRSDVYEKVKDKVSVY